MANKIKTIKTLVDMLLKSEPIKARERHHQWGGDELEIVASDLLKEGIIVPPCKVGQTVWFIRNGKIEETKVEKIVLKEGGLYLKLSCNSVYETTCRRIGKTVFFNKKDAEEILNKKS